jgi:hypothetical protein
MATSIQSGIFCYAGNHGTTVGGTSSFIDLTYNNFQSVMVGFNIAIQGAGVAGADYQGTVATFTDSHHITVTPNTSTTVTGAGYIIGTGGTLSSNWTTSMSVTLATAQSAGDTLCWGYNDDPAHSTPTISDSIGNSATSRGGVLSNGTWAQALFTIVCKAAGAAANTITCTFQTLESGYGQELAYHHFSGVGPYAQLATGNSSGAAVTTANFAATVPAGSTIWALSGVDDAVTLAGSGYTGNIEPIGGNIEEYQIVVTAGTFAGTCTQSGADNFLISAIQFTPPTSSSYNAIFFNSD